MRPGVGKIRSQAQALFPTLCQIVNQTSEIQLIVEALESNLPRILTALAEYTTDEEIAGTWFYYFNLNQTSNCHYSLKSKGSFLINNYN